ncbi:MAG: hypothetical protein AAFP96_06450, partial [Bacteroidota bacterium]
MKPIKRKNLLAVRFMNFKYLFLIGIVSLTQQCASWKKNLTSEGGEGGAIENAILDFSNSSRQFKEFNTFHILKVSSEKVIGLSILGDSNKWRLGAIRIGNTNKYFPSRFKEINGKLFYWSDSTTVITKDVLEVMKKYKVLDTVQYPNNI